ncbi:MAG: hypothetical protein P4L74_01795 [Candidatus Doudnabacteria bacterium]|nr:hypothetical protein [Candidatus Doudnabacteria bacterium]
MVERRVAGVDPSDRFIESFKYWLKGEHSDHPLANAVSHDGKIFQVKFEQLFTADAQTMEAGSTDPYASTITKYHLMASFLDWYRQNRDEKLELMISEVYSPNYAELFKTLIKLYPDKVELQDCPPMPEGSFDPMKPPPRSMSMPKRVSTIPDELKFISSEVCRIGLPETGPDMAQAVQEIKQLSESGDEINLKAKFYELAEKARGTVKQIESDYNAFLTGKLSAAKTEMAEPKDNAVTIKALEDEYNGTLLGRDSKGHFVDDFKEPTEQDAMRIVQMIKKSDASSLDLADIHFAMEVLRISDQRINPKGPNRELYSVQVERLNRAEDQILEQAIQTNDAHWQTPEEAIAAKRIPMAMKWNTLYHGGQKRWVVLNLDSPLANALEEKSRNGYL